MSLDMIPGSESARCREKLTDSQETNCAGVTG